jgi:pathogenesis-related protein 1
MRPFLALLMIVAPSIAQAQRPLGLQYPPSGPYRPYSSPTSLALAMLNAHNAIRARVGVPPLVWSADLTDVAQDWAYHLIATGSLSHRPNNRYGENIYTISGGSASPAQVVNNWAEEARGYDIRSNTCAGVCGHYTQIVWSKTRAVGCAVATDRRREVWVCNYDPPGNIIDERPY